MAGPIDFQGKTFQVLYTCTALLVFKILLMVPLTAKARFQKKAVMNPEDTKLMPGLKVKFGDPDVERVRRAHLNDLENIIIFISTAFLYTSLNGDSFLTSVLLITYTIARFAHTYVYAIKVVKQPARFICYAIGFAINVFMAGNVVLTLKD